MSDTAAVIAGYRVDATVDTGPLGTTYRATQIALARPVFLHVVSPPLSSDPAFRDEYLESARRAASLDHPSILPIHESGEHDGHLFLSCAYVDARTLAQIVADQGPLSSHRAARIVAQVADGLEAAHAAGVTHGEVSPSSVLVASRDAYDHAYVLGIGVPAPRGTSSAEDVDALGGVLAAAVDASDGDVGELLSGEYPSAAAFGRAARAIAEPVPEHQSGGRRAVVAAIAVAAVVVAIGALGAWQLTGGSGSSSSVAGIVSGEPIAVGAKPFLLKAANGSVWAQTESGDLIQVDETRGEPVGLPISEPAMTAWTFSDDEVIVGRASGEVIRFDPSSHQRVGGVIKVGKNPFALAVDGNSLWVSSTPNPGIAEMTITKHDLETGARRGPPIKLPAFAPVLIVAEGAIWAGQFFGDSGVLARIDPTTHRVIANIPVGRGPSGLAAGGGSLWVSNATVGSVMRIDTYRNEVAWTRAVPDVTDVTFSDDSLWVVTPATALRLDPESGNRLGEAVELPSRGDRIAAGEEAVWVLSYDAGDLTRVQAADDAPATAPGQTLEASPPAFPVEGPLAPGRYSTENFDIPFSVPIDEGWSLVDSEADNRLALVRSSDPRNVVFFEFVEQVFADGSSVIESAPANLVQWFRNHPHLTVRRTSTAPIGGLRSIVLEVAVTSVPKPNPPECGQDPCVLLFKDGPNSEFVMGPPPNHSAGPKTPAGDRFAFVSIGGKTLTVAYGTYGPAEDFRKFGPVAEKLLSTIEFR